MSFVWTRTSDFVFFFADYGRIKDTSIKTAVDISQQFLCLTFPMTFQ